MPVACFSHILKSLQLLFICSFFVSAFGSVAVAQVDDNFSALYGGYGREFKYIQISGIDFEIEDPGTFIDTYLKGKPAYDALKASLENVIYEIARENLKPEYGLTLFDRDHSPDDRFSINTMFIGGTLIVRDGRKMTPPVGHYVAVFDPMIGRPQICLQYPYYRYEHAEPMIMPDRSGDFVRIFRAAVEPMIKGELKRLICTKAENKGFPLCEIPCPPLGASAEAPSHCKY